MVMNPRAAFDLARRVRGEGAQLGEVFSFLSGLYFRGKLTYASRFGRARGAAESCYIITSSDGLAPPDARVTFATLEGFAEVPIDLAEPRYLEPLRATAEQLRDRLSPRGEIVLLGSIATQKYVGPLLECFGERLLFPVDFVGRGDMSRGGLLLRAAASGQELSYLPVAKAERLSGKRPPKLEPLPRKPKEG
jgi:hypothetical protein